MRYCWYLSLCSYVFVLAYLFSRSHLEKKANSQMCVRFAMRLSIFDELITLDRGSKQEEDRIRDKVVDAIAV